MDWFTWDPDYLWAIGLAVSMLLNTIQWVQLHGLSVFKKLAEEHGHAPAGSVMVPASTVVLHVPQAPAATAPAYKIPPPWEKGNQL